MKIPRIQGVMRRRILVNFRVDPGALGAQLPEPFRPQLVGGKAIAGICLIRLEQIRPAPLPSALGMSSENAAHRAAVVWEQGGERREGVYVFRRDSDSPINAALGGRLFPGRHHRARFDVSDDGTSIELHFRSNDGKVEVELCGAATAALPPGSLFGSVEQASRFFRAGSTGWSAGEGDRLDVLTLESAQWNVAPLAVHRVRSSWFEDERRFAAGSVEFDHALVLRDVEHQWIREPSMASVGCTA